MAVLAFLSCGNGSYTTPNLEGLLDERKKSFSLPFTKKLEEPKYAGVDNLFYALERGMSFTCPNW